MSKITFIGAGSTVFAKNLLGDILSFPELANSTISLHDIDAERLQTSELVARRLAQTLNVNPTIETTTDRRAALDGADYVISMFQVAGYEPGTVIDFEVPKQYGLRQTIADTLGIGGIMRGLRTIPVQRAIARIRTVNHDTHGQRQRADHIYSQLQVTESERRRFGHQHHQVTAAHGFHHGT